MTLAARILTVSLSLYKESSYTFFFGEKYVLWDSDTLWVEKEEKEERPYQHKKFIRWKILPIRLSLCYGFFLPLLVVYLFRRRRFLNSISFSFSLSFLREGDVMLWWEEDLHAEKEGWKENIFVRHVLPRYLQPTSVRVTQQGSVLFLLLKAQKFPNNLIWLWISWLFCLFVFLFAFHSRYRRMNTIYFRFNSIHFLLVSLPSSSPVI